MFEFFDEVVGWFIFGNNVFIWVFIFIVCYSFFNVEFDVFFLDYLGEMVCVIFYWFVYKIIFWVVNFKVFKIKYNYYILYLVILNICIWNVVN